MTSVPIILCTDEYNLAGLFVTMNSIYKNCSDSSRLEFYILVNESFIKNTIYVAVEKFFKGIKIRVEVFGSELTKKIAGYQDFCRNNAHCKNIMNFSRFFIPELFPEVQGFIYMDTDYLVIDDILTLWDGISMTNEFYAVPVLCSNKDIYSYEEKDEEGLNLSSRHPFNAGIYIVNANEWKKNDRTKELISLTNSKYFQSIFRFGTQPLLNYIFQGHYEYLPMKWNRLAYEKMNELMGQRPIDLMSVFSKDDLIKEEISAIHFNGIPKPWQNGNQSHGGNWPSPGSLYKDHLPYNGTIILSKRLLEIYNSTMLNFIESMANLFFIRVVFSDCKETDKRLENILESYCKPTDKTYTTQKYFILFNNIILHNATGHPDFVILRICEQNHFTKNGIYLYIQLEDDILIQQKNILEDIENLYKSEYEKRMILDLIFIHIGVYEIIQ